MQLTLIVSLPLRFWPVWRSCSRINSPHSAPECHYQLQVYFSPSPLQWSRTDVQWFISPCGGHSGVLCSTMLDGHRFHVSRQDLSRPRRGLPLFISCSLWTEWAPRNLFDDLNLSQQCIAFPMTANPRFNQRGRIVIHVKCDNYGFTKISRMSKAPSGSLTCAKATLVIQRCDFLPSISILIENTGKQRTAEYYFWLKTYHIVLFFISSANEILVKDIAYHPLCQDWFDKFCVAGFLSLQMDFLMYFKS